MTDSPQPTRLNRAAPPPRLNRAAPPPRLNRAAPPLRLSEVLYPTPAPDPPALVTVTRLGPADPPPFDQSPGAIAARHRAAYERWLARQARRDAVIAAAELAGRVTHRFGGLPHQCRACGRQAGTGPACAACAAVIARRVSQSRGAGRAATPRPARRGIAGLRAAAPGLINSVRAPRAKAPGTRFDLDGRGCRVCHAPGDGSDPLCHGCAGDADLFDPDRRRTPESRPGGTRR
jgi:hypothetical protein